MRSLLYTYFMLELNNKLLSYTTEVYEHNISTTLQGSKVHDESIKITFTYYGRNKDALRRILERDGIDNPYTAFHVDDDLNKSIMSRKHYTHVHFPDVVLLNENSHGRQKNFTSRDYARRRLACPMNCDLRPGTAPAEWMVDCYSPDSGNIMPDNPPNSPLPDYPRPSTMEMLRQRKSERVRVLASCRQRKRNFDDLPLITQARLQRSCDAELTSNFEVIGTRVVKRETSDDEISWLEKENFVQDPFLKSSIRLPKIDPPKPKTPTCLTNKSKPYRKLKPEIRKFGKHSPKLEFINVINPMNTVASVTPTGESRCGTPQLFDTGKLRINYSLEHIRPDIVRKPMSVKKEDNHAEVLKLTTNILHDMGNDKRYQTCNDFAASGDKWTCDHSDDWSNVDKHSVPSVPLDDLFKARLPSGFAASCLNAIDEFVVRKEQVTTSRLYVTVTMITFNRIPMMPY
ncbi:uncharacterized protein [Antedon mediterranea]|uniref:uncharacterized protein n=1 Tax=Antedon mediterranea TaxID=105859 RepID=UPI003AF7D6AA